MEHLKKSVDPDETRLIILFDFILYDPVNNFSVMSRRVFLGYTSTKQGLRIKVACSRTGEARTRNPSVSSQAFYH